MKKLIRGIVTFRKYFLDEYQKKFSKLSVGQKPDTLFIGCSDSRLVPNIFASSDPGDLFMSRNVGNLVAPYDANEAVTDESTAAVIEFALTVLNVSDIIVCGHSECGATEAVLAGREQISCCNLRSWLRHLEPAYAKFKDGIRLDTQLAAHNQISQLNVLEQIEHLKSYPLVQEYCNAGKLRLHGWWFDLGTADVFIYDSSINQFVILDEDSVPRFLNEIKDF